MDIFSKYLPQPISTELVWEAAVDVNNKEPLGIGPLGERSIVRITGGRFQGGPNYPSFYGKVLAGGADRQLVRPDGVTELSAIYEMEVHDGTVISIANQVLVDPSPASGRYAMSRIQVTAPRGEWDWLNRKIILGTLQSARPELDSVIIRGWVVDTVSQD
ncbi:MAG: DUF3237 domain-containing protein [Dehalococcoidia bacterium]|jgi:hypothetical protein